MTKRKRFDAVARPSAIAVFEDELKTRSDGYVEHLVHGGKADCGEEFYLDALYMAIAALREQGGSFQNGNDHNTVKDWPPYMDLPREQEERSKGCKACEMTTRGLTYKQIEYGTLRGDLINDSSGMYIIRYGGGQHSIVCDDDGAEIDIEFCPMCGRRLEEV